MNLIQQNQTLDKHRLIDITDLSNYELMEWRGELLKSLPMATPANLTDEGLCAKIRTEARITLIDTELTARQLLGGV